MISMLAEETAKQIARNGQEWMKYLDTAARLYKYPFNEQMLIYAQRPDASACASLETWNEKMNCWVNRGAKGIALIDTDSERPRLKYVFDVSDVHKARRIGRDPYLWELREEHKDVVLARLENIYGETDAQMPFEKRLIELAEPLTPPYSETFADESFLESYTIIDSNQDRTKWEPYLGSAQISYNSELDMDDWLITPALNLEGGKMYSFSIEIMTGGSFNETFEVMFGKDKTPEALVNPIIEKTSIAHTVYKAYTGTISPAESGTFYVGIHGCSQKDMLSLSVKNLKIGAAAGASTPSAPSNLVVNTRTNGELKADISLTAPTKNAPSTRLKPKKSSRIRTKLSTSYPTRVLPEIPVWERSFVT